MRWYSILILFALVGCFDEEPPQWGTTQYVPVMVDRADFEAAVSVMAARDVHQAGKIYTIGNYIFLNERFKGIHVIDNTDPANPLNKGFINIPGNVDMAVKGNTLYADSAVDLLAIDISNPQKVVVTSRQKDTFPELIPPDMDFMPDSFRKENREEKNTIIVDWKKL
ncbi:MAG: hypothetical protein OEX02_10195 [Cyclobacteriaceae bacterium]|nr:hypothetical protein [Cyclobacteriaceae bacterium]